MRTENLDAIRMVHLPSKAEDAEYRKKLNALSTLPPLSRRLGRLGEVLSLGMWSKGAEISQELLRDAPDSIQIRRYALVGFCRSDFAAEIASRGTSLKR